MIAFKVVLLAAVLLAGLGGGAFALRRGAGAAANRSLARGNAFAAGIFLGAGLIHMLPDAADIWRELGWHYPMAFVLATLAFILMLLFEHVLLPEAHHHVVHEPAGSTFEPLLEGGREGFGAYVVLAALSLHSLLAGLALGAEDHFASALVIFLAIMAHKASAGFALGVSLVRSAMRTRRAWALLAVFAVSTPLGILLGALLNVVLDGRPEELLEASFLALAAGTFVYVATFDILRDEFLDPVGRSGKWWLVCLGAGLMGLLALFV